VPETSFEQVHGWILLVYNWKSRFGIHTQETVCQGCVFADGALLCQHSVLACYSYRGKKVDLLDINIARARVRPFQLLKYLTWRTSDGLLFDVLQCVITWRTLKTCEAG